MRVTTIFAIILICFLTAGYAQQPMAKVTAPARAFGDSDYRLGPDDVIQIFVWKEAELSTTVVVRPDGKVSVPLIGELTASGKTAVELQNEIGKKLTQYIADPVVNVIVKEVNSAKVSILGEVKNPGVYKLNNRATVLDVIAQAGGFTEYAKRGKVTLIRTSPTGEQKLIPLNVEQIIKGKKSDSYVLPNDKINVR